jgi:hypothetical protein
MSAGQNSDRTFILRDLTALIFFVEKGEKYYSGAAAMLRRPLLSSTVMLSPPLLTICCNTIGDPVEDPCNSWLL